MAEQPSRLLAGNGSDILNVQKANIALIYAYRLFVCLLLLVMFQIVLDTRLVGDQNPVLFIATLTTYGLLNTLLLALSLRQKLSENWLNLFACTIVDIIALNLIIQASGAQSAALSLLFIIVVVGAASVLSARLSLLVAALASLSVLGNAIFMVWVHNGAVSQLATAGVLGLVFFITAYAVQRLVTRASRHEALARKQAADIAELQQLNEKIVQRMRTGILVLDQEQNIRLINEAARQQLNISEAASEIVGHTAPNVLRETWQRWSASPSSLATPFIAEPGAPEVRASFSALGDTQQTLAFLEDTRQLSQQAQQLKLASLGRLTASIAHEIRNPLGAISHAAQLLSESDELADHDKRFTEIIEAQCRRVNYIIENVLSLSRRNTAKPEEIHLQGFLTDFIGSYQGKNGDQDEIRLVPATNAINVTFDPRQLDQIITNLVENGLRYSLQHTGRSKLRIEIYVEPTTDLPQLDIIDYGPGIEPDMEQHIFEPFFTTENEGTGLGLYLAREMCEANQAQLSYIQTVTGSSCFRISFAHPKKRWASDKNK